MPIKVQAFRILYHFGICLVIQGEELEYLHLSPFVFFSFCTTVITIILLLLVLTVTFHIAADVAATVLSF